MRGFCYILVGYLAVHKRRIQEGDIVFIHDCPLPDKEGTSPHRAVYLEARGNVAVLCGITSSSFNQENDIDKISLPWGPHAKTGLDKESHVLPRWVILTPVGELDTFPYKGFVRRVTLDQLKQRCFDRMEGNAARILKHRSFG